MAPIRGWWPCSDYYERTLDADEQEMPFQAIQGWMLHLAYGSRDELPRPMQREVACAGWEVAAADAYPVLVPIFTPGGGLSRELIRRLRAVLRALTTFADEHGSRLREGSSPLRWDCGELVLCYEGEVSQGPPLQDLPPHLEGINSSRQLSNVTAFPRPKRATCGASSSRRCWST